MDKKKLKTPDVYETFQFRVSKEQKNQLHEQIERVVGLCNEKRPEKSRVIRKNDVIVAALLTGLSVVKKYGFKP